MLLLNSSANSCEVNLTILVGSRKKKMCSSTLNFLGLVDEADAVNTGQGCEKAPPDISTFTCISKIKWSNLLIIALQLDALEHGSYELRSCHWLNKYFLSSCYVSLRPETVVVNKVKSQDSCPMEFPGCYWNSSTDVKSERMLWAKELEGCHWE